MAHFPNDNNNNDNTDNTNNNDMINKFNTLQTSTKLTLKQILQEIRKIDKDKNLTIGKYHDANQQQQSDGLFNMIFGSTSNEPNKNQLCEYSIFASNNNYNISIQNKMNWVHQSTLFNKNIDRAVGCMIGMGIGDAVGHPLEFVPITSILNDIDKRPKFDYKLQKYYNEYNKFRLKRGQWTDDAAMGLCQADSLIINDKYDGSDIRIRFWNWWNNGYCNAFRKDKSRSSSVGLGGNISSSIHSCKYGIKPKPRYIVKHDREDSGNGSLMRLAPLPVYYHNDINNGRKYSFESSFTTHPGYIAGESCSLLAYIIINAIHPAKSNKINFVPSDNPKKFMDIVIDNYKQILLNENVGIQSKMDKIKQDYISNNNNNNSDMKTNVSDNVLNLNDDDKKLENELCGNNPAYKLLKRERNAKKLILRLLQSAEPSTSKEYCWNWKSNYGELPIISTYKLRAGIGNKNKNKKQKFKGKTVNSSYFDKWNKQKYNGYPVSPEYWGSYCMDGLAMAMHCVYHSVCFADAIQKCVNLLGDADSTGSIGGQIAGAIYGYQSIINDNQQKFLVQQLVKWDDYDFAFRAVLLYILGDNQLKNKLLT